MAFLRNCWYVAAWSREVGRWLTARTILEEKVVLYRTEGDEVVAFLDVCPHRLLPLSKGRLKGDSIECGYHGVTFGCDGKCERIPGQSNIPPSAKVVKKYPVAERMGMVWIWMGAPELADENDIFDLPQYHNPEWSVAHGDALEYKCNYLLLADNLCDPAHVTFVHQTTLGSEAGEDVPVETVKEGNTIITYRWIIDAPPIPIFQKFGNFKGNVDRWHYYNWHAPNIAIIDFGSADTGTGAPEGNRNECIHIYACHFMTPVDETTTIDYWMHVKNFKPQDPTLDEQISDQFRIAFAEDKEILDACQEEESRGYEWQPLRLAIDKGSNRMRHLLKQLLAEESESTSDQG